MKSAKNGIYSNLNDLQGVLGLRSHTHFTPFKVHMSL